jgi:hypothetical protein
MAVAIIAVAALIVAPTQTSGADVQPGVVSISGENSCLSPDQTRTVTWTIENGQDEPLTILESTMLGPREVVEEVGDPPDWVDIGDDQTVIMSPSPVPPLGTSTAEVTVTGNGDVALRLSYQVGQGPVVPGFPPATVGNPPNCLPATTTPTVAPSTAAEPVAAEPAFTG